MARANLTTFNQHSLICQIKYYTSCNIVIRLRNSYIQYSVARLAKNRCPLKGSTNRLDLPLPRSANPQQQSWAFSSNCKYYHTGVSTGMSPHSYRWVTLHPGVQLSTGRWGAGRRREMRGRTASPAPRPPGQWHRQGWDALAVPTGLCGDAAWSRRADLQKLGCVQHSSETQADQCEWPATRTQPSTPTQGTEPLAMAVWPHFTPGADFLGNSDQWDSAFRRTTKPQWDTRCAEDHLPQVSVAAEGRGETMMPTLLKEARTMITVVTVHHPLPKPVKKKWMGRGLGDRVKKDGLKKYKLAATKQSEEECKVQPREYSW